MHDISAVLESPIEPAQSVVDSKIAYDESRQTLQKEMAGARGSWAANAALLNNAANMDTTGRVQAEHIETVKEMAEDLMTKYDWQNSLLHVFDKAATKFADDAIGGQLRDIAYDMADASQSGEEQRVVIPKMLAHAPRMFKRMASLLVTKSQHVQAAEMAYDDNLSEEYSEDMRHSPYIRMQVCMPIVVNVVPCAAEFSVCPKLKLILCHVRMVNVMTVSKEFSTDGLSFDKHIRFVIGLAGLSFTFSTFTLSPFLIFPVCGGEGNIIADKKKTGARLVIAWKSDMNDAAVPFPGGSIKLVFGLGFGVKEPAKPPLAIMETMFVFSLDLTNANTVFAWNVALKFAPFAGHIFEGAFQPVNTKRQWKVNQLTLQDLMDLNTETSFGETMAMLSVTCAEE